MTDPVVSVEDRRILKRWIIVFVAFGLIWRLARFGLVMPIWGDEAMLGLNIIGRSYRDLLKPLNDAQVAPVGFLWLLRFTFDSLGISDYTTRLPAIIAGITALLLFWQWSGLLVSRQAAMLATGVVAVSGYIVRHGVELKPYSMDFLATLLLLLPTTKYLLSQRLVWLIALIFAVPICMVISYPVVFTAGGIAVALLFNARRAKLTGRILSLLYCIILGISFLAIFKLSGQGQYQRTSQAMLEYWKDAFPPANPLKFITWFIQIHTGNMFAYPVGGKNGASLVTVIFFAIGMCVMWRHWKASIRLMLLIPFLLTFIAAVLRRYPYGESARVAQHLAPAIILMMGAGIAAWIDRAPNPREWRIRLHFCAGALLGIGIMCLAGDILWPYKTKPDLQTRTSIRAMFSAAKPDEPFLVVQKETDVPPNFRWYLQEQYQHVAYDVQPSTESLAGHNGAWVINCNSARAHLVEDLAVQTGMKANQWLLQKLQIGPRQQPPAHLEIIHLTR